MAHASLAGGLLFNGGFDDGTYKPWQLPQCANYGHPNTTRTFGNFYVTMSPVGQGRYAGRFQLPADPNHLTRCQVLAPRAVNVGGDDWYSLMLYLPKGWSTGTNGFWGAEILNLNMEGMPGYGAPVDLQAHNDHVTVALNSGTCGSPCQYRSNADSPHANLPPLYAIPRPMQLGVWHELILHVHWATDSTGLVAVWHRVKGKAVWKRTAFVTGYPTLMVDRSGWYPTNTADKIGVYRAESYAPTSVWLDAFSRSQSFATAAANLP
jgi:hypothetical protein